LLREDYVRLYVYDPVSVTNPFVVFFRKIGVGVPYQNLSSKREFRADQLSNSHTLIITVSEIVSVLARVFGLLG